MIIPNFIVKDFANKSREGIVLVWPLVTLTCGGFSWQNRCASDEAHREHLWVLLNMRTSLVLRVEPTQIKQVIILVAAFDLTDYNLRLVTRISGVVSNRPRPKTDI